MAAKTVRERELAYAESLVQSEVLSAYQQFQFNQQRGELYRQNLLPKLEENLQRLEAAYQLTGEEIFRMAGNSAGVPVRSFARFCRLIFIRENPW